MKNKLPNFIIAGFPKCGSTALHYYLEDHPQIYMPKQKELHFFTNAIISKLNQGTGDKEVKKTQITNLNDYLKCFENVKTELAVGDASPSYANYPEVLDEINKQLNNPKIVLLLRDPIQRAYSNYLHLKREHRETLDFYNALKEEKNRRGLNYSDFWYYKFNSTYYDKIVAIKTAFNEVMILTQEELNNNTAKTIKKVYKFLSVDPDYEPKNIDKKYNIGGIYKDNLITKFIFKPNKYKTEFKKIIPVTAGLKHLINKLLVRYRTKPLPIDKKTEEYLINEFKEDVKKVKGLGVDTSFWNKGYFE